MPESQSVPLVSVCIPCYNSEKYVGEAIESALNQTYRGVEVVIVDDGSIDRSRDVLVEFATRYPDRVRVEFQGNSGACAARNRALALSSGEFINFLDADDRLCPGKVERQLPSLLGGDADIVLCKGMIFGDGKPLRPKRSSMRPPIGEDALCYSLSQGFSTEGPLHRRSCLERVGGFRVGLRRAQEWELHVRLTASGARLGWVPEYLYEHRNHAGTRITQFRPSAGFMGKVLLQLSDELVSDSRYVVTEDRARCLAGALVRSARGAFRSGDRAVARELFGMATQVFRNPYRSGKTWLDHLSAVVGGFRAERVREIVQRKRGGAA